MIDARKSAGVTLVALVVTSAIACHSGRQRKGRILERTREGIMGTRVTVKVWLPGDTGWIERGERGIEAAFDAALEVHERMSPRDPDSAVSRINASAGGDVVAVDDWTWEVLVTSLEMSERTAGAFDPTWAVLSDLWPWRVSDPEPPAPDVVADRLPLVDHQGLILDPQGRTARLARSGMRVGLGGSAKGFALDRMAEALQGEGIDDFICYAGGDLIVRGSKGDRAWALGVQHPRDPSSIFARYEVDHDMAVVTSGDYERYFVHDGHRYHHILDPSTGYPASSSVSVTVLGPDGLRSDALSTGLFVLGPQRGMELVERLAGFEALIVDPEGSIHTSSGLGHILEVLDSSPLTP